MDGSFHRRCGSMVTVSNNGRTAQRNHPAQEFNNGVVLSAEPIRDNHLFEVKIDRKVLLLSISGVAIYHTNLAHVRMGVKLMFRNECSCTCMALSLIHI